jgi:hypothetical protein
LFSRSVFRLLAVLGVALQAGVALGDEPQSPAAAEALFDEGKNLMRGGNYAEACPKLEESFRLDAATGALYAVALCHEGLGKLATAWVEFMDAAGRSNAEHNAEREQSARRHAEALQPRLSYLTVRVNAVTAHLPGLSILHDGVTLRPAAWGTPIPVDPGEHELKASAPGYVAWQTKIQVGTPSHREAAEIPELSRALPPVTAPPSAPIPGGPLAPLPRQGLSSLQITGIGLGSAGVASLLFAGFASWRALQKKSDSNEHCPANVCSSDGREERLIARESAKWATAGSIAGGVLLGAGAALFVVGMPRASARGAASGTSVAITGLGLRLDHRF